MKLILFFLTLASVLISACYNERIVDNWSDCNINGGRCIETPDLSDKGADPCAEAAADKRGNREGWYWKPSNHSCDGVESLLCCIYVQE